MSDQDDKFLIGLVKQGDKKAFDKLVIKYQQRIIQLVARYVRDPSEAQDVAQETFIKAYRSLPNFRGESAFYTWLYRIAVNTAKNYLVSRARRSSNQEICVEDAENFESAFRLKDIDSPELLLVSEETRQAIKSGIEALPEDLRRAISLREFNGLSYNEIALKTGCPVGTVRSRIFRAREEIAKLVIPFIGND